MKKLIALFLIVSAFQPTQAQEIEVYKTDSVTAVRSFIYINEGNWIKSGAIILSRLKNFKSGKEHFGYSIATTNTDSRAREIPEGVTILIKHLDKSVSEFYTESGEFSQRERTTSFAVGGRYAAFATTISTYSYSYSCEISRDDLKRIAKWGISKMRVDTPGPGWKDFDLTGSSPVSDQLIALANMAKRLDGLEMETVKPDSYSDF